MLCVCALKERVVGPQIAHQQPFVGHAKAAGGNALGWPAGRGVAVGEVATEIHAEVRALGVGRKGRAMQLRQRLCVHRGRLPVFVLPAVICYAPHRVHLPSLDPIEFVRGCAQRLMRRPECQSRPHTPILPSSPIARLPRPLYHLHVPLRDDVGEKMVPPPSHPPRKSVHALGKVPRDAARAGAVVIAAGFGPLTVCAGGLHPSASIISLFLFLRARIRRGKNFTIFPKSSFGKIRLRSRSGPGGGFLSVHF